MRCSQLSGVRPDGTSAAPAPKSLSGGTGAGSWSAVPVAPMPRDNRRRVRREAPSRKRCGAILMRLRALLRKQALERRAFRRPFQFARFPVELLQCRELLVLAELGALHGR